MGGEVVMGVITHPRKLEKKKVSNYNTHKSDFYTQSAISTCTV
jgi:hypothetical protein